MSRLVTRAAMSSHERKNKLIWTNKRQRKKKPSDSSTSRAHHPSLLFCLHSAEWSNAQMAEGAVEKCVHARTHVHGGRLGFFNKNDCELQRSVMLFITKETALCTDLNHICCIRRRGARVQEHFSPLHYPPFSVWLLRRRLQMNVKRPKPQTAKCKEKTQNDYAMCCNCSAGKSSLAAIWCGQFCAYREWRLGAYCNSEA